MSDTVKRLFQIIDQRHIAAPPYVAKHRDNREAHLENDLRMDSLDKSELVECVWDEFEYDIPDDKAEGVNTVGDLAALIDEHVRLKAARAG